MLRGSLPARSLGIRKGGSQGAKTPEAVRFAA